MAGLLRALTRVLAKGRSILDRQSRPKSLDAVEVQGERARYPGTAPALEYVYYLIKAQLDQIDGLDGKAGLLMGFSGAMLGLVINGLDKIGQLPLGFRIASVLAAGLLAASALLALRAYRLKRYWMGSKPRPLAKDFLAASSEECSIEVLSYLIESFERNEAVIGAFQRQVTWSMGLQVTATMVLAFVVVGLLIQ